MPGLTEGLRTAGTKKFSVSSWTMINCFRNEMKFITDVNIVQLWPSPAYLSGLWHQSADMTTTTMTTTKMMIMVMMLTFRYPGKLLCCLMFWCMWSCYMLCRNSFSQTMFVVPVTLGWIFAGLVVFIILSNIIVAIIVHRCSRLDIHGCMKRLALINMPIIGNAVRLRCFGTVFIYLIIHWTRTRRIISTVYKPKYADYNYMSLLFSVIKQTYNYTMINLLRADPKGPKGMGAFAL